MQIEWQQQIQITLAAGQTYAISSSSYLGNIAKYKNIAAEFVSGNLPNGASLDLNFETSFEEASIGQQWTRPTNGAMAIRVAANGGFAQVAIMKRDDAVPPMSVLRWYITNSRATSITFDFRILLLLRDPDCSCGG